MVVDIVESACTGRVKLTADRLMAAGLEKDCLEYRFWLQVAAAVFVMDYSPIQAETFINSILEAEEQSESGFWMCLKHRHIGEKCCLLCLLADELKKGKILMNIETDGFYDALTYAQKRDMERWDAYQKMLGEDSRDAQGEEKAAVARAEEVGDEGTVYRVSKAVCTGFVWLLVLAGICEFARALAQGLSP